MLRSIEDLLLESAAPPSNWMPSRAERLADARDTLRRRFGERREELRRPSHRLRDLGSAHPLFSGTRIVSGEQIEADLEADVTTVNPPVLQGWAMIVLVVVGGAMFVGLGALVRSGPWSGWQVALGLIVGAPFVWVVLLLAWGFGEHVVELDGDGVHIRRWTDVWLVGELASGSDRPTACTPPCHVRSSSSSRARPDRSDSACGPGHRVLGPTPSTSCRSGASTATSAAIVIITFTAVAGGTRSGEPESRSTATINGLHVEVVAPLRLTAPRRAARRGRTA